MVKRTRRLLGGDETLENYLQRRHRELTQQMAPLRAALADKEKELEQIRLTLGETEEQS